MANVSCGSTLEEVMANMSYELTHIRENFEFIFHFGRVRSSMCPSGNVEFMVGSDASLMSWINNESGPSIWVGLGQNNSGNVGFLS